VAAVSPFDADQEGDRVARASRFPMRRALTLASVPPEAVLGIPFICSARAARQRGGSFRRRAGPP